MDNNVSENKTIVNVVRGWLAGLILLMPFQHWLTEHLSLWSNGLAFFIQKLDDISIFVLLPLAIIRVYREKNHFYTLFFLLLLPVIIFALIGIVSGTINGNHFMVTAHGIYDYVKSFIVILIYAAFFSDYKDFHRIFRLLLSIAVFICLLAVIQEGYALFSRYYMGKNITDYSIYILRDTYLGGAWRLGIYRAPSVMAHYNVFGLYSLLIMTVYLSTARRVNVATFLFLLSGIFVSMSRMIYSGFLLILGFQIFKKKWALLFVLVPLMTIIFFMIFLSDFKVSNSIKFMNEKIELSDSIPFRIYAREKAMEVWRDHPIWGVGPGMFGGSIAMKYNSSIYEEYGFYIIKQWFKSLDQFWPQLLAETGIAGMGAFSILYILLFDLFLISRQKADSREVKNLFSGIIIFALALLLYTFGSNLNIITVLYTYFAFVGIGVGCVAYR